MSEHSAEGTGSGGGQHQVVDEKTVRECVQKFITADYFTRTNLLPVIESATKTSAEIVTSMILKNNAVDALDDLTYLLEEIGKPAVEPLVAAIQKIEIKKSYDVYALERMVDTVRRLNGKSVYPVIAQQVDKLNAVMSAQPNSPLASLCYDTKAGIHKVLADAGEKSKLEDLLLMLGDGNKKVRTEIIEAIGKVGNERALIPLIRIYAQFTTESSWLSNLIRDVFKEICKREKISPDSPVFGNLTPSEMKALQKMLPKFKSNKTPTEALQFEST